MDADEKRLVFWWAVLVVLTAVSLEGVSILASKPMVTATILVIAFVKVRIVVHEFMEVRAAPPALQCVLDIWVAVLCAALVFMAL